MNPISAALDVKQVSIPNVELENIIDTLEFVITYLDARQDCEIVIRELKRDLSIFRDMKTFRSR